MKKTYFNIDKNTICYQVNWMGIETILINDVKVSKKLSWPRIKHQFDLDVFDKKETFYIKSKQSFSTGNILVQLFHNDVLIDERIIKFHFYISHENIKDPENSTFMTGLILLFLSIAFDWSRFFIFIGLICIFSSLFEQPTHSNKKNSGKISDTDDELPIT